MQLSALFIYALAVKRKNDNTSITVVQRDGQRNEVVTISRDSAIGFASSIFNAWLRHCTYASSTQIQRLKYLLNHEVNALANFLGSKYCTIMPVVGTVWCLYIHVPQLVYYV